MVDIGQDDRSNVVSVQGGISQSEGGVFGSRVDSALAESVVDVRLDFDLGWGGDNWTGGCGLILGVTKLVAIECGQ